MADATATRDLVRRWADEVVTEAGSMVEAELREAAPLGESGDTRRGVSVDPAGGIDRLAVVARSTGKGGDFVEEGTRAWIKDLRGTGRVMRFLGGRGRISQPGPNQRIATRGDGVVFTAVVHHPAVPARPWFGPVVARWDDFLRRAAARVVVR